MRIATLRNKSWGRREREEKRERRGGRRGRLVLRVRVAGRGMHEWKKGLRYGKGHLDQGNWDRASFYLFRIDFM